MYMVNSYLQVLKSIDSSWGDANSSVGSKKSSRRWRSRISRSSQGSRNDCSSSSESGLFSEELVNSGYFGDDEVERCRCARCLLETQARTPKPDFTADYDIISVDLSACETPKQQPIIYYPRTRTNYDEYIIIPSSKEEFVDENPAHSTPVDYTKIPELDVSSLLPYVPAVRVDIQNKLNTCCSRELLNDIAENGSCSPSPPSVHRIPSVNGSARCWWRENILWQLQERNNTQTKRFSQLQTDDQRCRAKVRINKELADYLNRHGELRSQNETSSNTGLIDVEVEPIERSELVLAIRNHGTSNVKTQEVGENPVKSDSIAHLASTYLNRQKTLAEDKLSESEDSSSPGCENSRMSSRVLKRSPSKTWRESMMNQLQMRNFLECKYFTDALARRAMAQLSVSENMPLPGRGLDEYDIITDDEVSSLDSRRTLMNFTHSTSLSQGYYSSVPLRSRFFKRGKRR